MSDLLFNEVPVNGAKYNFGDWKAYTVHNDKQIKGFFGDYRWLSNFYPSVVTYDGIKYPSIENAYQAAKIIPEERYKLIYCSAAESKKIWKTLLKINETAFQWDARKYQIMAELVFDKFLNNIKLRQKLVETGNKHLEETNHWSDTYWGVDIKKGGQNNLGKILMQTREYWQNK